MSTMSKSSSKKQNKESDPIKFAIDVRAFQANGRSFPYMVYTRMSERGKAQAITDGHEVPGLTGSPSAYMKIMASICSKEPGFIVPGTTISEAIFKLLLVNANKPLTVGQIQERLAAAWASVIYLKNLSDEAIRDMLSGPNEYFIRPV